jgi:UDP-N-acetylmuramoyl-tripeptide--D-alanyl-D-alanine ligase
MCGVGCVMFSIPEIAAATGGRVMGPETGQVTGVSTDSRSVVFGELFVPLRGERFDAHDYIDEVIAKGIRVILVEEAHQREVASDVTVIIVRDTLAALGDLAATWRKRFDIPVIGITGSNGKTTTKEMLAAILERTGSGLKTGGNLNNLIGLPQMLFRLRPEHCWAVLEMGMSEPGEIDRLAEIAAPRVGVVLNAFTAHLESMGSVENVARAKGELLVRLPVGGCAVFNAGDPLIAALPSPDGVRRLSFGSADADVRATGITPLGIDGQRFTLHLPNADVTIHLRAFGGHNIGNALAAAAAAHALGIPVGMIRDGLEGFRPYDKRFQVEQIHGLVLIDDSYNANPASMAAALATLAELKGDRRAFVALGAMLELGSNEASLHRELGVRAAAVADRLYLYGDLTRHTAEGALRAGMSPASVVSTDSHDKIVADILSRAQAGDFVLVKGSRGMRMEKVAEGIRNKP